MSSRSLAAARARRAGDSAPPVSGNRPGTSIGSHAAFSQQQMGPPPPNNVRLARSTQPPPQYSQQQQQQQQQNNQYYEQPVNQKTNGQPFTKISISDAIGLITLRLGRVEQWIIETDHENENNDSSSSSIPDNHKIIDSSVLTTIINRLDSLEKNGSSLLSGTGSISNEQIIELKDNVTKLTEQFTNVGDEVTKHRIELAKQTEQVFRFNRELTETKDILKSFMVKYDIFTQEMTNNFSDYETALSELEKRMPVAEEVSEEEDVNKEGHDNEEGEEGEDGDEEPTEGARISNIDGTTDSKIMSFDLKNIIKQELANA